MHAGDLPWSRFWPGWGSPEGWRSGSLVPDVEGIMSSHVNIIYIMVSFFVGIWLDTLERLVHFV